MQNIIYSYINEQGTEMLSIGSSGYMKQKLQTARQLIRYIGIKQTEEERYRTTGMTQDQLYNALTNFAKQNELYLIYPN